MPDPFDAILVELQDERKRLDQLLDEALEQYALYEEGMNARMKVAGPEEMPALMAERSRMEETLGIAELVERIDAIRERVAGLKAGDTAA